MLQRRYRRNYLTPAVHFLVFGFLNSGTLVSFFRKSLRQKNILPDPINANIFHPAIRLEPAALASSEAWFQLFARIFRIVGMAIRDGFPHQQEHLREL